MGIIINYYASGVLLCAVWWCALRIIFVSINDNDNNNDDTVDDANDNNIVCDE